VGVITTPEQANSIIMNEQADMILIAREFLRNPYFPLIAAQELEAQITYMAGSIPNG
jgi:2,4-dienoyl-CoA reductase-like NADH-dependent reductase (Old Yellow Enzyme family)